METVPEVEPHLNRLRKSFVSNDFMQLARSGIAKQHGLLGCLSTVICGLITFYGGGQRLMGGS